MKLKLLFLTAFMTLPIVAFSMEEQSDERELKPGDTVDRQAIIQSQWKELDRMLDGTDHEKKSKKINAIIIGGLHEKHKKLAQSFNDFQKRVEEKDRLDVLAIGINGLQAKVDLPQLFKEAFAEIKTNQQDNTALISCIN